ncbi:MAG TPA: hypothetical protein VKR61_07510 [Bryobacteraceae bacterium]|nr:hypothetical protein [Bryobacteraceae bacterium]
MVFSLLVLGIAVQPLSAQQTVTQFISTVEAAISSLESSLTPSTQPLILGGQNILGQGLIVPNQTPSTMIDYTDGLKASSVQRLEFNPGVTTINNSTAVANLDAMVRHLRQLGMQLAINPEFNAGEIKVNTFQDFQNTAIQTYPALAARYHPDNFVIVHEPTTQAARMQITTTPQDWVNFITAVEPLIKKASPHTQVGAGDCSHCNELSFNQAFSAMPTCNATNLNSGCLDFITMDIYDYTQLSEDEGFAQNGHAGGKAVYMEETFAPHYLPNGLPAGYQSNPQGVEYYSPIGSCDVVFEQMDQDWLTGMAEFSQSYGMTAMTVFTTQAFFLYTATPTPDKATDPAYLSLMLPAIKQPGATLTSTATFNQTLVQQRGIKTATSINNASYSTLPSNFNPTCGTADNPCNADSTVAADMLVSVFGTDLATKTLVDSTFPTTLGGTTANLVDSANNSFAAPLYLVSPYQVNCLVPSNAANGPATLTITSGDGAVSTSIVLIDPVAPGLYTSYANGQGPAAAIAVCYGTCSGWPNSSGNQHFWQYTFVAGCTSGSCAVPLQWGANDVVAIELYGTGIRHNSAGSVSANINGQSLKVDFAAAQGTDTGLDQINVEIPNSLHGAGTVNLTVSIQDANAFLAPGITKQTLPVQLNFQ